MKAYKEIAQKSPLRDYLVSVIKTMPAEAWVPYYNFMALPLPQFVLDHDPIFIDLRTKYSFHAGVVKLPPNTCYNWHTDMARSVAINMLVEDNGQSRCLFRVGEGEISFPFVELKYKPDTYYVFNTKVPHTVLNFSLPRYMFSVEFLDEDRGLTFDELCQFFEVNYGN